MIPVTTDSDTMEKAAFVLDCIDSLTEHLLQTWTQGKFLGPKHQEEMVRKAHKSLHQHVFSSSNERFVAARKAIKMPVTRAEAYELLHKALCETETDVGRRLWIEKWYPKYYHADESADLDDSEA